MIRSSAFFLAAILLSLSAQPAAAQGLYTNGIIIEESINLFDFLDTGFEVMSCFESCSEMIVERTEFTCARTFFVPTTACDLPYELPEAINPFFPNPLPWSWGETLPCVPEDLIPGPYKLEESHQLVKVQRRHNADCTMTVTEEVVAELAPTGTPPSACNGLTGVWTSTTEVPQYQVWSDCSE